MNNPLAKYPAVFLALFLTAGIIIQNRLMLPPLLLAVAFLITLLFIFFVRRKNVQAVLLLILIILAGFVRFDIWHQQHLELPVRKFLPLQSTQAYMTIIDPPAADQKFAAVRLDSMRTETGIIPMSAEFMLFFYELPGQMRPGDRLLGTNLQADNPPFQRNPGQFNYQSYLERHGITGVIYSTGNSRFKIIPQPAGSLSSVFGRLRIALNR
ncbi:MAG: DUF4131 domain-containing protein, partial [Calditrichia bacterium]